MLSSYEVLMPISPQLPLNWKKRERSGAAPEGLALKWGCVRKATRAILGDMEGIVLGVI